VCIKKNYSSLRTNLNAASLWYLPCNSTWFLSWNLEAANNCDNSLYICQCNSTDFLLRPSNNIYLWKTAVFLKQSNSKKSGIVLYFLQISLISGLIEDSCILISATNLLCYHAFCNLWKTPEFHSRWKNKSAKGKCFFVVCVLNMKIVLFLQTSYRRPRDLRDP